MAWLHDCLAAFDLETDGPDPEDARIITATVLLLGGGLDREDHAWLLRTERPIPAEATAIHHIVTEYADKNGVDRLDGVREIAVKVAEVLMLGTPVVAFNGAFDFTVLDRECKRVGVHTVSEMLDDPLGPILDPHVIDKAVDKFRKGKRTLGATCEHYGVELGNAHDSTADALGAARLAYVIAKRYPEIGDMDLADLHEAQIGWRREQSASFQAYKRRTDPDYVVNGDWPLQGGAS
jgi:DNA polymerase III subunit epsilon